MLFHQINFCTRVSYIYGFYRFKNLCYDNIKAAFKNSNHAIIVNLFARRYVITFITWFQTTVSLSQFSFPISSGIAEYQTRSIIIPALSLYHYQVVPKHISILLLLLQKLAATPVCTAAYDAHVIEMYLIILPIVYTVSSQQSKTGLVRVIYVFSDSVSSYCCIYYI